MKKATLKMKDLEALCDVRREAIHFYLREGLLPEPRRPKRNVALYSNEHVVRIKLIKRLQEERLLPLSQIKSIFERLKGPLDPESRGLAAFELTLLDLLNGDVPDADQSLEVAAERSGLSVEQIERLAEHGVVEIKGDAPARQLDFRDVNILVTWGQTLQLGYAECAGYDESYLGRVAAIVRELVDFEMELFLRNFRNELDEDMAAMGRRSVELGNEMVGRLRTQAILRRLSEVVTKG